ncbi:MAG TPA: sensor histidine kinase, partial [Clostridia bacterium]
MDILRNPWVKKNVLIHLALGAAATVTGFLIGTACGILALCLCLLFTLVHYLSDRKRYRKISELSDEINKILHSRHTLDINEYAEGELSILSSEIYKMTVRMREQAELLEKDKQYLVDSMANIS